MRSFPMRALGALIVGGVIVLLLLLCVGPALLIKRDALPVFVADIPIWHSTSLTLRNGPDGACHPLTYCPRNVGMTPGLSIWITTRTDNGGYPARFNERRLLYLPSNTVR